MNTNHIIVRLARIRERMKAGIQPETVKLRVYVLTGQIMFGSPSSVIAQMGIKHIIEVMSVCCLADLLDNVLNIQHRKGRLAGPAGSYKQDCRNRTSCSHLRFSLGIFDVYNRACAQTYCYKVNIDLKNCAPSSLSYSPFAELIIIIHLADRKARKNRVKYRLLICFATG